MNFHVARWLMKMGIQVSFLNLNSITMLDLQFMMSILYILWITFIIGSEISDILGDYCIQIDFSLWPTMEEFTLQSSLKEFELAIENLKCYKLSGSGYSTELIWELISEEDNCIKSLECCSVSLNLNIVCLVKLEDRLTWSEIC